MPTEFMYEILDEVTKEVVYPSAEELMETRWVIDHIRILPDSEGPDSLIFNLRPERCTCHPTPPEYHTTYYGITEPGSAMEQNPDCEAHHA